MIPYLKYYFFIAFSIFGFVSFAQTTITWTGNYDNDWHKACNWSPSQVPTCQDDVIVPYIAIPKYQPTIENIAGCKSINIKSDDGAVVTLHSSGGNGILQVSDDGSTCSQAVYVTPPPDVTANPSSVTICSNTAPSIDLTSTTGATFAWSVTQSGVSGATDGSGSSIAQTLTNSGTTAGTVTYAIIPSTGSCAGTSTNVVITVNPIPNITANPSSETICSGVTTNIALTSNVLGTTFAWTVTQSGVTGTSDGSGSSIAQMLTNSGTTSGTATYTITPTANGCNGTSINVIIIVLAIISFIY